MKTYCKGYALTRAKLRSAYDKWLKGGSGRKNAHRISEEYGSESAFLDVVWRELNAESLRFEPIKTYAKRDPNSGKLREISVESVKRQVCNYLCVDALEPLLAAKVGFWQVSSGVEGKGAAMGMRKLNRAIRRFLLHVHIDIRNCYGSMLTEMVYALVARYVRNRQVLYLLHALLSTMGEVLILGSYLSLRLAALVISFAYHAVEGAGTVRRGKRTNLVGCQVWYADDGYLLGNSKKALKRAVGIVARVLAGFGLALKPWKIMRNGVEPVDFAGYRIWCGHVDLRKMLWKKLRRAFARFDRRRAERLAKRASSYWGWIYTARMERQMVARQGILNAARLFPGTRVFIAAKPAS